MFSGYGSEDSHFVVELTYNYNIKKYDVGNDFNRIVIKSNEAYAAVLAQNEFPVQKQDNSVSVTVTGGYTFEVIDQAVPSGMDPVQGLVLNVSDLARAKGSI